MRIGFVLDDTLDRPDGVQQYVLGIGNWLTEVGHEVHYIVTNTKRTDIENIHSLGRQIRLRFNGNSVRTPLPVSKREISELLGGLRLDVVHIQMPYSPLFGERVIKNKGGAAAVATFHILPYSARQRSANRWLGTWLRETTASLETVIAPTQAAQEFASLAYGVKPITVPHPVNQARFGRGQRVRDYDDTRLTIVFLGRLEARKGVHTLIEAYRALNAEVRTKARLVIAGYGPELPRAQRKSAGDSDITFTGYVNEHDKPNILASADIAVFPSSGGESFGMVLTEAISAGSGVVIGASNPGYSAVLGATPECLFEPKNAAALRDLIERLILDESLRSKLHTRQQKSLISFELNTYGERLLKIYEAAIESAKA